MKKHPIGSKRIVFVGDDPWCCEIVGLPLPKDPHRSLCFEKTGDDDPEEILEIYPEDFILIEIEGNMVLP